MAFFVFSIKLLLQRFAELVGGPFVNSSMLWIALPLLVTLIVMELYFGRYKKEKLGWNTALTNTLVLIFVSLNLFQRVFTTYEGGFFKVIISTGFFVSLLVFILGILLFLTDFFHWISKKIAFVISAHLSVNTTAYVAVVIVYNQLPLDFMTILAWLLLIILLGIIFFFVKRVEPKAESKELSDS
nr:hypothetical protein [Nanoarchaeota archaeon]